MATLAGRPDKDGYYFYPFDVTAQDGGLLVTTDSSGTYQWSLRQIGADLNDPMYPDPQDDPMYPTRSRITFTSTPI